MAEAQILTVVEPVADHIMVEALTLTVVELVADHIMAEEQHLQVVEQSVVVEPVAALDTIIILRQPSMSIW